MCTLGCLPSNFYLLFLRAALAKVRSITSCSSILKLSGWRLLLLWKAHMVWKISLALFFIHYEVQGQMVLAGTSISQIPLKHYLLPISFCLLKKDPQARCPKNTNGHVMFVGMLEHFTEIWGWSIDTSLAASLMYFSSTTDSQNRMESQCAFGAFHGLLIRPLYIQITIHMTSSHSN